MASIQLDAQASAPRGPSRVLDPAATVTCTPRPVEPQKIHALVRSSWPSDSSRRVLPDVYVTGELSDLRAALSESDPGARLRVFTGYAGWGKGQLEAEVLAGGWVLDTADARQVFSPDSSGLWERVYSILERLVA